MRDRSRKPQEYEKQLACPPLPPELAYLWRIFLRLNSRRGSNGFSPSPISFLEIEAYCRLAGVRLSAWELEVIEELDRLKLASSI